MKMAIMQPYFFPYIGYWQLINAVDIFVVYDNIKYTKKSWINRNNILVNGEKKLFTIPLKKDSDYLNIVDRCLANNAEQQIKKTILQIENNYSKAPYFKELLPVIKSGFYYNETNLFKYLFNSIQQVCKYLHIKTKLIVASKVDIDHSLQCQNKVIALNRKLGADIYINAIGGLQLYDSSVFLKNGIELKFIKTNTIEYPQFSKEFKSYMSIIDVMMFNSAETINQFLKEYTLI